MICVVAAGVRTPRSSCHGSNAKPRQRSEVPGEAQRARSEPGTTEQLGKIVAPKQPNENITLAEDRVRDTQSED